MQENPIVTIICLCYNHENFVLESLYSVVNQYYKNIELIIVDDCSNDNSNKIIREWLLDYPNIPFITNEFNLGNTKSFNKALKIAKGEYIIDLASDDILLPNCVLSQINAFNNNCYKNLGVVYGNVELINENGTFDSYYFDVNESKKVIQKRATGDIYLSVLSGGDSICSVSAMIKKTVLDKLNGYDELLAFEDLDFWIRASRIYEFDFIDEVLIQKRIVTNSLGTDFFKKTNSKSKKINYSTYLILKKAIKLNRTKKEDLAILKRVHFEILHCWKNKNYVMMMKNSWLKMKLNFRIYFIRFT